MQVLANHQQVIQLIDHLAKAIACHVAQPAARENRPWALVGIRSRGDVLARRLAEILKPDHLGVLDITLYRDDLSEASSQPIVRTTEVCFGLDGLDVVLVDDVLMTGRSVRAALQSLMDLGRPRRVWLAVLVDRGGRELPIAADYVGLDLTGRGDVGNGLRVSAEEKVSVCLEPTDAQDAIIVGSAKNMVEIVA